MFYLNNGQRNLSFHADGPAFMAWIWRGVRLLEHKHRCVIIQQRNKQGCALQSLCFLPRGSELQTAKSGSGRLMLRVLLLIPYPEERKPPEQFIFSPLAVFQYFYLSPMSTHLQPDSSGPLLLVYAVWSECWGHWSQGSGSGQDCSAEMWPVVEPTVVLCTWNPQLKSELLTLL